MSDTPGATQRAHGPPRVATRERHWCISCSWDLPAPPTSGNFEARSLVKSPTRSGRCEGTPRGPVSGGRRRRPRASEWIPHIPRPDKEAESAARGGGGSCYGLHGDALRVALGGLLGDLGISSSLCFLVWAALRSCGPPSEAPWLLGWFVHSFICPLRWFSECLICARHHWKD